MTNKILEIIIGFDRRTKTIVQIFVDTMIVIISIFLAVKVLSEHLIPLNETRFLLTVGIVVPEPYVDINSEKNFGMFSFLSCNFFDILSIIKNWHTSHRSVHLYDDDAH